MPLGQHAEFGRNGRRRRRENRLLFNSVVAAATTATTYVEPDLLYTCAYEASSIHRPDRLCGVPDKLREHPNRGARKPGSKTSRCHPTAGATKCADGRS